jgi:hypothetical protein
LVTDFYKKRRRNSVDKDDYKTISLKEIVTRYFPDKLKDIDISVASLLDDRDMFDT